MLLCFKFALIFVTCESQNCRTVFQTKRHYEIPYLCLLNAVSIFEKLFVEIGGHLLQDRFKYTRRGTYSSSLSLS